MVGHGVSGSGLLPSCGNRRSQTLEVHHHLIIHETRNREDSFCSFEYNRSGREVQNTPPRMNSTAGGDVLQGWSKTLISAPLVINCICSEFYKMHKSARGKGWHLWGGGGVQISPNDNDPTTTIGWTRNSRKAGCLNAITAPDPRSQHGPVRHTSIIRGELREGGKWKHSPPMTTSPRCPRGA